MPVLHFRWSHWELAGASGENTSEIERLTEM